MKSALLLSILLACASAAAPRGRGGPTLEAGQRDFKRGDYSAALRTLDAAAADSDDPSVLSRIHLLRGQCFAAQQDFSRAEEAFNLSLEHDPEAALDPARVDPSLVKMLDGLRARLRGELWVRANRPAAVSLDGKPLGSTPLRVPAPIGRHTLSAKAHQGRYGVEQEVVIRARRENPVELTLTELKSEPPPVPSSVERHPVADVRMTLEPVQYLEGPGFEVGGGLEQGPYRVTGHARLVPEFGITARGALRVPLEGKLSVHVELEAPMVFLDVITVGLGGSAGVEYQVSRWLGVFGQAGGKHYFTAPGGYTRDRAMVQAGLRLRPP